MNGHSDRVTCVVFSPWKNQLISGSWDGTIKLWDFDYGKEIITLKNFDDSIDSLVASEKRKLIIACRKEIVFRKIYC